MAPRSSRQEALVLQAFGHVAIDYAQCQTLGDRRLADPGFARSGPGCLVRRDSTCIVRGFPRPGPITGSSLALARHSPGGVQVTRIALQRVIAYPADALSAFAALAQILDRRVELLPVSNRRRRAPCRPGFSLAHRQREQQPLDGDKAVAGLLRDLFGLLENRAISGER